MIYFSADQHINHKNILKYCQRPFKTIEDHDAHLLDQINKYVKPEDTLYFLGDLLFANKKYYAPILLDLIKKINCNDIRWICGNHDPKKFEIHASINQSALNETWNKLLVLGDYKETYLNNSHFVMCHYAMAIWNKSHRGSYHIYGHSHASAEDNLDRLFPGRRAMDVGVDNAARLLGEYRPFSINEVVSILDKKYEDNKIASITIDHHK